MTCTKTLFQTVRKRGQMNRLRKHIALALLAGFLLGAVLAPILHLTFHPQASQIHEEASIPMVDGPSVDKAPVCVLCTTVLLASLKLSEQETSVERAADYASTLPTLAGTPTPRYSPSRAPPTRA